MQILTFVNIVISILFVLCYLYQFIYIPIALFAKKRPHKETVIHDLAVLISAHNEEAVIGNLLQSLNKQDYPKDRYRIFVVADNCTDRTAEVAAAAGAVVYTRHNTQQTGKGYALNYLLGKLDEDYGKHAFDAFVVFDADNLAETNFLTEINKTYSDGYEIITSYRNSKNYGDSWVSAGSGMWFIREARFMNGARMALGSSAVLAGTGFLFSDKVKEENGGWPYHCLTEDTEFMVSNALRGHNVGYAADAEFFDEQPIKFSQSWFQRIRWARGGLQVFGKYWKGLIAGIFSKNSLTCYDFTMSVAPAFILSILAVFVNIANVIVDFIHGNGIESLITVGSMTVGLYLMLFCFSALITLTEWKRLRTTTGRKILYMFTFPLFMFTYVPVAFCSLFGRVKWKPIAHTSTGTIEDLHNMQTK